MTPQEYQEYENAVKAFFASEGISNLSSGHLRCPECDADWSDNPNRFECCGADKECWDEPSLSWTQCECCGTREDGNREHATGWNETTKRIQTYDFICEDCIYYVENGVLDDKTMSEITEGT